MNTTIGKIRIGGLTIPVVISDTMFQKEQKYGEYNISAPEITISRGDSQRMTDTFWHEVIEAISDTYDLKLKHRQINVLAAALHQLHDDTPVSTILDTLESEGS